VYASVIIVAFVELDWTARRSSIITPLINSFFSPFSQNLLKNKAFTLAIM
jgi:hypothetical protein